MNKRIANAVILIIGLSLVTWLIVRSLPTSVNTSISPDIQVVTTILLTVITTLSAFRDVIDLFPNRNPDKEPIIYIEPSKSPINPVLEALPTIKLPRDFYQYWTLSNPFAASAPSRENILYGYSVNERVKPRKRSFSLFAEYMLLVVLTTIFLINHLYIATWVMLLLWAVRIAIFIYVRISNVKKIIYLITNLRIIEFEKIAYRNYKTRKEIYYNKMESMALSASYKNIKTDYRESVRDIQIKSLPYKVKITHPSKIESIQERTTIILLRQNKDANLVESLIQYAWFQSRKTSLLQTEIPPDNKIEYKINANTEPDGENSNHSQRNAGEDETYHQRFE